VTLFQLRRLCIVNLSSMKLCSGVAKEAVCVGKFPICFFPAVDVFDHRAHVCYLAAGTNKLGYKYVFYRSRLVWTPPPYSLSYALVYLTHSLFVWWSLSVLWRVSVYSGRPNGVVLYFHHTQKLHSVFIKACVWEGKSVLQSLSGGAWPRIPHLV
jgi:hypothetical protein